MIMMEPWYSDPFDQFGNLMNVAPVHETPFQSCFCNLLSEWKWIYEKTMAQVKSGQIIRISCAISVSLHDRFHIDWYMLAERLQKFNFSSND